MRRDHEAAVAYLDKLQALVAAAPVSTDQDRSDTVYERNPAIEGPMGAFGYSYLSDHYGADKTSSLRLRSYSGLRGGGGQYVYETLNFVDGKKTASDIRDWLTTELGPVPLEYVTEYLEALESIDVIRTVGR